MHLQHGYGLDLGAEIHTLQPLHSRYPMAAGRSKRKLKNRPKYKQVRSLKDRRMKAKKSAAHKRGLNKSRKRRAARGKKKR